MIAKATANLFNASEASKGFMEKCSSVSFEAAATDFDEEVLEIIAKAQGKAEGHANEWNEKFHKYIGQVKGSRRVPYKEVKWLDVSEEKVRFGGEKEVAI